MQLVPVLARVPILPQLVVAYVPPASIFALPLAYRSDTSRDMIALPSIAL